MVRPYAYVWRAVQCTELAIDSLLVCRHHKHAWSFTRFNTDIHTSYSCTIIWKKFRESKHVCACENFYQGNYIESNAIWRVIFVGANDRIADQKAQILHTLLWSCIWIMTYMTCMANRKKLPLCNGILLSLQVAFWEFCQLQLILLSWKK